MKNSEKPDYPVPEAALGSGPKILHDLASDLLPELFHYPKVLYLIRKHLFQKHNKQAHPGKDTLDEIKRELRKCLSNHEKDTIDIMITMIHGMKYMCNHYQLVTPDQLDHYLDILQLEFYEKLPINLGFEKRDLLIDLQDAAIDETIPKMNSLTTSTYRKKDRP